MFATEDIKYVGMSSQCLLTGRNKVQTALKLGHIIAVTIDICCIVAMLQSETAHNAGDEHVDL